MIVEFKLLRDPAKCVRIDAGEIMAVRGDSGGETTLHFPTNHIFWSLVAGKPIEVVRKIDNALSIQEPASGFVIFEDRVGLLALRADYVRNVKPCTRFNASMMSTLTIYKPNLVGSRSIFSVKGVVNEVMQKLAVVHAVKYNDIGSIRGFAQNGYLQEYLLAHGYVQATKG